MAAHSPWSLRVPFIFLLYYLAVVSFPVFAFEVPIIDTDYSRQVCSGMWGGPSAYINVSFDSTSQGQLAMVIYEWKDVNYLGKSQPSDTDDIFPKIYICTNTALSKGYCTQEQLGRFIIDIPSGKSVNETSFWSALLQLSSTQSSNTRSLDHPANIDSHPPSSSLRRRETSSRQVYDTLLYKDPIHYPVAKTGFYCVATVPVTVSQSMGKRVETDVPFHTSYKGTVLFQNVFRGQLPATDYPKVNFYFAMFVVYIIIGAVWAWFCFRHLHELLPIQFYLSGLAALLVIEMLAHWVYYRYLNAHGKGTGSSVFLIVVSILDAGRNSMSFFMLLVVSLGLSVVRESLGRTMYKCQALAAAHFLFGILYSIGIVELELESTSAIILLIFVIPLAFTLSGFLLWIMYSLNSTIAHLRARKQRYKVKMFEKLHYILLSVVVAVAIFFVISSLSFSGRFAEDYAANTWQTRWWLLDGYLSLLYLAGFMIIIFLWRPSENNRRLMLSEEIAQDEEDAEDYDLEAIQHRTRLREEDDDDDAATLVAGRTGHPAVATDDIVFEIGEEDEEDEDGSKKRKNQNRLSGEVHEGTDVERQALVS